MIQTYSKNNKVKLSDHFNSTEFDCSGVGCCSTTRIDTELVEVCEKVRQKFGKAVIINSGYRCLVHNKAIGGANSSQHVAGKAADIKVSGIDPLVVGFYLQDILQSKGGIEVGSYDKGTGGYVHVDTRSTVWRAYRPSSKSLRYISVNKLDITLRTGMTHDAVTILTRKLCKLGYLKSITSKYTAAVAVAVKNFQKANGLAVDGIFGSKSWAALIKLL